MKQDLDDAPIIEPRTIDRWPYFWLGCALTAIKYNLDRLIAWQGFHRSWYLWNYIKPHGYGQIDALPPSDERFYFILLLTSLPFLLVGIVLTLRRLRSAGLPLALCVLFFVPVINLVFFAVLSVVSAKSATPTAMPEKPAWISWLPQSAAGSALASTLLVGLAGVAFAYISTSVLQNYGWGLFVALPFAMGLVSVLIYAGPQRRSLPSCMLVAILPIGFAGLCLFFVAMEGAICLIMAAPIGVALALAGGCVSYLIVGNRIAPSLR